MQKARVIITPGLFCARNCSYCCNHFTNILAGAVNIDRLADIPHRDVLMITGGEPMEHLGLTWNIIHYAKTLGFKTVYLYTARWKDSLLRMIKYLDGIHYTLHAGSNIQDVVDFGAMQAMASKYPDKSFRAYLHPDLKHAINIMPYVWQRVEVKPWLSEEECPLPEGETLYRIKV